LAGAVMSKNSKKIKTILLKARYLESELELVEEDFTESHPDFKTAVEARIKELKEDDDYQVNYNNFTDSTNANQSKKDIEIEKRPIPEEFKKIYRKIMLIVHPDKLVGMSDLSERDRLERLAVSATSAVDDENWYSLTSIAIELGINLDDVPDEYVLGVDKSCANMERKIKSMKGSYVICWKDADDKRKEKLIDQYIELRFKG
jgi:hypothetical protein